MSEVPFTQYLRLKGERRETGIERSPEIMVKAQAILNAGFHFECEILLTGYVHLTVSDQSEDFSPELCHNGPDVPEAVDRLIARVYNRLKVAKL